VALPSIDSFQFTGWPDRLRPRQRRHRLAERADVDGADVVWSAWFTDEQTIRTVADTDGLESAKALAAAYRALISQTVTVVDDAGQTFTGVTVLGVEAIPRQTLLGGRVSTTWTLLPSATSDPT
jgi:hypothetical protein